MEALGVGVGPDAKEVWVTEQLLAGCEPLLSKINSSLGDRGRYKYEIER